MAVALKGFFEKRNIALTRARFRAWWEGEDFDKDAALAAIEAQAANDATEGADEELFDEEPIDLPARLQALATIWGEDRVRPGDATSEALEPARVGLPAEGVLAVLSPGLAAPLIALAAAHPGKIEAFEWRDEALEPLNYGLRKAGLAKRVSVTRIDLEAHVWPAQGYDGLLSIDDFAYAGFHPHLAHQVIKCLKPGACAVIETYVGLPAAELKTAFASSFAEPQIHAHGDVLQVLKDVGFKLESDEDLTDEFIELARQGFKRLSDALSASEGVEVATAREMAWEAEAWRMRLKLLAQRRLERRRIILRRPVDGPDEEAPAEAAASTPEAQTENTNTPAG